MAGYNSKFTGQQVDSLLEKAGSSYQKPETGIPQSDLAESTQQILQNVENKVNKEEGKGLSTNDFTDEYKAKVEDSASQEGYFPKMSVGIAANLAGRGEATEQVFTYRPTDGGTSIESGVAKIRRVKGNSVVWNQRCDFTNGVFTFGESSGIKDAEGYTITTNESNTTATIFQFRTSIPFYSHKWLAIATIKSPINVNIKGMPTQGFVPNTKCDIYSFFESAEGNWYWGLSIESIGTISEIKVYNYLLFDLTQIFGAGNEPTTVEEFRALYPDSYYPYNAGELRNLDCSGIKTVGFNQWDEQWEVGYLNADGTTAGYVQNYIRAKNYIPVIGGAMYYAKLPNGVSDAQLYAVDENYNLIKNIFSWINNRFFIPDGAAYIRFYMNYGSEVYNNDICINLHHTGWRDGEYEPYKEVTHSLPLSQITNGEPLRKAGSVYDEINETHYIKRVGVVDLGSLSWSQNPGYGFYVSIGALSGIQKVTDNNINANILCTNYTTGRAGDIFTQAKTNLIAVSTTHLVVGDLTYNTVNDFKSAMAGVMLNYELAEPIVTPIETSLNLDYQAEDFGTEEALLTDNSAPFSADIVYQFNAVDRIRENSLDIEDLLARVIALENAAATTTSIPDIPDITE